MRACTALHGMRAFILVCLLALAGCTEPSTDDGSSSSTSSSLPSSSSNQTSSSQISSSTTSTSPSSPTPRPAQTFTIDIQGNDFKDGSKTIQKGDTVRWVQKDQATHTVTSDDGTSFDSGNLFALPSQDTFTHTFDAVGDFPYHCDVHPGMTDAITVVAVV